MSESPPPEQLDDIVEEADEAPIRTSLSLSPSILRPVNTPRPLLSEAPSVSISLPDVDIESLGDETTEQRHRRRMRFLEMRREHYSQMHQNSERCTMTDDEEQEFANTSRPKEQKEREEQQEAEDKNKPK